MSGQARDQPCDSSTATDDPTTSAFLAAVGTRVRLLRVSRGLSQRQLAEAAGIHRTVIGRIERGQINFGTSYLLLLAEALGVDGSELVPDIDEPSQDRFTVIERLTSASPTRSSLEWEAAFVAESIRTRRGPYLPHDLVIALQAAPLATVELFLNALAVRAGEDMPAEELWAIWDRMASS